MGEKGSLDVLDQPFEGKPVALQSCARGALGGARLQYHAKQNGAA